MSTTDPIEPTIDLNAVADATEADVKSVEAADAKAAHEALMKFIGPIIVELRSILTQGNKALDEGNKEQLNQLLLRAQTLTGKVPAPAASNPPARPSTVKQPAPSAPPVDPPTAPIAPVVPTPDPAPAVPAGTTPAPQPTPAPAASKAKGIGTRLIDAGRKLLEKDPDPAQPAS